VRFKPMEAQVTRGYNRFYLPDAIGEQAKQAELPFSRMLRAAVEKELLRRATMTATLEADRHLPAGSGRSAGT
jgi:post-segregation antitoxin (ccd killing protein)